MLKNPLCLANRKNSNFNFKYLEDTHLNISDLLIYFTLNLIIYHVNGIFDKYENINKWYCSTMAAHIERYVAVLDCYKSTNKSFNVSLVDKMRLENDEILKIALNELNISENPVREIDGKIEDLKVFIEKHFSLTVPLKLNRFYTENDIKLDWDSIDKQLNPQAGF